MKKIITVLLTATLLIAGSAYAAGTLQDAEKAYAKRSYVQAFNILKPLALSGVAEAQFDLGACYEFGLGVAQDYVEAVKWYKLAAEQGNAKAQFGLGASYDVGQGVLRNYVEAVKWYKLAAEQGNASAQTNLGIMYAKGLGVAQDFVSAHKWFNLAAITGTKDAVKNRDAIEIIMSKQQIEEAQKLARECLARKYKGC